jgi:hypothetical protein
LQRAVAMEVVVLRAVLLVVKMKVADVSVVFCK